MPSYAVQTRTSCDACGSPLPLNAVVPELACPPCSRRNVFSDQFWLSMLSSDDELTGSSTVFIGNRQVAFSAERRPPLCDGCGRALVARELETASEAGWLRCDCGVRTSVRRAADSLSSSGLRLLVGEDERQLPSGGAELPVPEGVKPVYFGCPQCGGTLKLDGSTRLVTCEYCSAMSYLPDDLWHVFHPVRAARPWFAVYGRGLH
jgi:DNA-directed RNA polymerase subunit RPC12/RpoP